MKFALQKVCVPKIGFWGENLVPQEFALHTPNSCRNSGASSKLSLFFGGSQKSQFLENFRMNCMRRGTWGRAPRSAAQRSDARIIVKNRTITTKGGEEKLVSQKIWRATCFCAGWTGFFVFVFLEKNILLLDSLDKNIVFAPSKNIRKKARAPRPASGEIRLLFNFWPT